MRHKFFSLVAAAALLASVGAADAKGPVKLTDVQLDEATAGAALALPALWWPGLAGGLAGSVNTGLSLFGVSMNYAMNGVGILQANQTTAPNVVQLNAVAAP
jgi:hypothetical protein